MPDCKTTCPYCKQEITSWGLFRHIMSKHEEEFLTYKSKYFNNHEFLHSVKSKTELPSFTFGPDKLVQVCFGCMSSYSKVKMAFGHHDKCEGCKTSHFERLNALREKYPQAKDLSGAIINTQTIQTLVINNYNRTEDPAVLAALYMMKKELNDHWKQINTHSKKNDRLMAFLKRKYPEDAEEIDDVYNEISEASSEDETINEHIKRVNKKFPDFKVEESKAKKAYEETIRFKV